jgi:hypothetical protein
VDFTLWVFVKVVVLVPPIPSSVEALKIKISQDLLRVDEMMLDRIWEELEYYWEMAC